MPIVKLLGEPDEQGFQVESNLDLEGIAYCISKNYHEFANIFTRAKKCGKEDCFLIITEKGIEIEIKRIFEGRKVHFYGLKRHSEFSFYINFPGFFEYLQEKSKTQINH
jgi:hypothetical protein